MKYFLFIVLLFNFIFPIRLRVFVYLPELVYALSFIWLIFRLVRKRAIGLLSNKRGLKFVLFASSLAVIAAISSLLNATGDLGFLRVLANFMFSWIYAATLLAGVRTGAFGKMTYQKMLVGVIVCVAILGVTIFIEVLSPGAKAIFSSIISKSGNIDYAESFRSSGIAAGGGAALSFGIAIGCGLALIVALSAKQRTLRVFCYFAALLLLVATMFVGRTGMVLAIVFLLVSLRYLSFGRGFNLIVTILAIAWFASAFIGEISTSAREYYQIHSFELFNSYVETGRIESKTTDAVADMYFVPDAKHLVMGAGYINGSHFGYPSVDPGYMKVLMAIGLIGFVLFYSGCAVIIRTAYGALIEYSPKLKLLLLVVLLSYFIFEAKEPGLYQNYAFRVLVLMAAFPFMNRSREHMPKIQIS